MRDSTYHTNCRTANEMNAKKLGFQGVCVRVCVWGGGGTIKHSEGTSKTYTNTQNTLPPH